MFVVHTCYAPTGYVTWFKSNAATPNLAIQEYRDFLAEYGATQANFHVVLVSTSTVH